MTMQVIQHTELTGLNYFIDFNSIPQTFTDLLVVISAREDGSVVSGDVQIWPNGSSSNQSQRSLIGNGSSASSSSGSNIYVRENGASATSNTFSSSVVYIPNYTSSVAKSFSIEGVAENNATEAGLLLQAGLWNVTSAITSLRFVSNFGQFVSGSSATLYGILKGSSGGVTVS